ncbi:MAG: type II secretion system protein [Patescibacteria group bacterium]
MNPAIRRAKRTFAGFTLAELIVVITVLAVLATVGFLALSGYSQDAKDSVVAANVRSLQTAISSESVITNNSPRYYVIHNSGASLSGAFAYVDGTQTTLTGGDWNVPGTNYSAGNPDYAKLKLNPEKFKTASLSGLPFSVPSALAAYGQGLYDSKYLTVGAMDSVVSSGSKPRLTTYFQVAGISAATGKATVTGNFPANASVTGSVA